MLYAILKPLAVLVMRLLFRVEARGTEHVPAEGAVLIVPITRAFSIRRWSAAWRRAG